MEEDLKYLKFLALNSKEIVEKQVDSYRQQYSYTGTVIGVSTPVKAILLKKKVR